MSFYSNASELCELMNLLVEFRIVIGGTRYLVTLALIRLYLFLRIKLPSIAVNKTVGCISPTRCTQQLLWP